MTGPTEDEFRSLAKMFNLHDLSIEDALQESQRPKIEEFPEYLYVVVRPILLRGDDRLLPVDLNVFVMERYVITVCNADLPQIGEVKRRIQKGMPHLREGGTDFLLHAIIDAVVDSYYFVLDRIEDDIEEVEDQVVARPTSDVLERINNVKRDLLMFRRNIWPLRDAMSLVITGYFSLITGAAERYFRDVSDHVASLIDLDETYHELVSSARDSYLSAVSNRMNDIMKRLTVVATIVLPLTVITGIYGMNFEYMPELEYRYSYFIVLGVMAFIAVAMLWHFEKEGYL